MSTTPSRSRAVLSAALLALAAPVAAQAIGASYETAAAETQRRLEASLAELAELRAALAAEKVPLARELARLEGELSQARTTQQEKARAADRSALTLSNLAAEIKARETELDYLGSLFGEYARNFESRLHIAELQRFDAVVRAGRLAAENTTLSRGEVLAAQAAVVESALQRLDELLGGARFVGTAVDADGREQRGTFVQIGPAAVFRSDDGTAVGVVQQRLGSLAPAVAPYQAPEHTTAAGQLVSATAGMLPFDPTLGDAQKVEAVHDGLWAHVAKGGPVMFPILGLAGVALLVALYKWLSLVRIGAPSAAGVAALLASVSRRDHADAARRAAELDGPVGEMLATGVAHLGEPRELVEEVMYESILSTRLRLQRMLPFVAITASSAPLLGLLGTVTGIMNTFSLMTVFGTGDVKTLSSGISEALITTEFGLYVAIPSLLLHAFLARKTRAVVDQMEKAAVALLNRMGAAPAPAAAVNGTDNGAGGTSHEHVRRALVDLLEPVLGTEPNARAVRAAEA